MIEFVLLFEESGILLKKLEYAAIDSKQKIIFSDPEELVASFFSVMFTYFTDHFGKIQAIHTTDRIILIRKVKWMYLAMVLNKIKIDGLSQRAAFAQEAELFYANKRIEETCFFVLKEISALFEHYYIKHPNINSSIITSEPQFNVIIAQIDERIKARLPYINKFVENIIEKSKIFRELYPALEDSMELSIKPVDLNFR